MMTSPKSSVLNIEAVDINPVANDVEMSGIRYSSGILVQRRHPVQPGFDPSEGIFKEGWVGFQGFSHLGEQSDLGFVVGAVHGRHVGGKKEDGFGVFRIDFCQRSGPQRWIRELIPKTGPSFGVQHHRTHDRLHTSRFFRDDGPVCSSHRDQDFQQRMPLFNGKVEGRP